MVTQLRILQNELDCYQPGMNQCARLVVANKMVVSSSEHDMVTQLRILQNELDCYQPGMNQCARLVVANKMDVLDRVGNESMSSLARVTRLPVLPVSALHSWNIDILMKALTADNQSYAV